MPPEYATTDVIVQGSALVATTLLVGLTGVAFLARAISRLFAASTGRL